MRRGYSSETLPPSEHRSRRRVPGAFVPENIYQTRPRVHRRGAALLVDIKNLGLTNVSSTSSIYIASLNDVGRLIKYERSSIDWRIENVRSRVFKANKPPLKSRWTRPVKPLAANVYFG